ncbi:MAG: phenylalanine--tRNA ligase subunit alpha [Bacteroidales bacterium]|nr:phenylalanine--tRNA ligase subunit alpha [Deltaproteobacteria bacterium]MBL7138510.1 phenylalanine--tRNA ligase subunit alpha [Bacteroidales bacterium]
MQEKIEQLLQEIENLTASAREEVEQLRLRYLSKKGVLSALFEEFRTIPNEEKRVVGQLLNELKTRAGQKLEELKASFEEGGEEDRSCLDLTRPTSQVRLGARHPLSIVRNQITGIFARLGYSVAEGPEIENDWYNFSALNFPAEHPAKDMQDTYFIQQNPDILLRTHTSSVQIREMERLQPPIRKIFPGRVFRNEAISARAHCIFHQVEGLYVDKDVSFADLKQSLYFFARELFGAQTRIRLRPSFFPFTEPSGEVDISCNICGGEGCTICKYTGWVEILGCGMVDPQVLANCHIDPETYTGFAFGMGIERITMLKYQIRDLRLFFENDVRFLKQFTGAI